MPEPPRRVMVLGSTGSIGVNALCVIDHLTRTRQHPLKVVGLAAGRRTNQLIEQARATDCPALAIGDESGQTTIAGAMPEARVFSGPDAAKELVCQVECDVVISAMVGVAGLAPTLAALERGRDVCLANKEPLVAAGPLVTEQAKANGARLTPIDSEHSAIAQCLAGTPEQRVKRVVLTASGGPFRQMTREQMEQVTLEQALRHPTWDMGPKITIDSATMMNKALEIIEAHHLFGLPPEKIDVMVHPESVVHSFVEFTDHSVMAQLGTPDMRLPIQYALTGPDRPAGCSDALDLTRLSRLNFEPPDGDRFPALRLAYQVLEAGGTAGAIFNAANEAAVAAFLDRRIQFLRIVELVAEALAAIPATSVTSLEDVLQADAKAREWVEDRILNEDGHGGSAQSPIARSSSRPFGNPAVPIDVPPTLSNGPQGAVN